MFRAFPGECQGIGHSQAPTKHCQTPESDKKKILRGKDTKRTKCKVWAGLAFDRA